ncbi:MAG TPA: aminoacyl-tRNA hydrolase [Treponemataceae bacterium]|nr:aminoacyl-tRNA hydrolase [Treponemataceae bacterium]
MIQLAAFLGNYGKKYEKNRHNVAWLFADSMSTVNSLSFTKKFKGDYALEKNTSITEKREDPLYYIKPETYMNLSGESIAELANFYKIKPENILVVHDELELPLGTISLKWSGGLGGHNGLRSAKACLGTADFWRLRFGIGRPDHNDVAGYVLSDFNADERICLSQIFPQAEEFFTTLMVSDPKKLETEWKKKNLLP